MREQCLQENNYEGSFFSYSMDIVVFGQLFDVVNGRLALEALWIYCDPLLWNVT